MFTSSGKETKVIQDGGNVLGHSKRQQQAVNMEKELLQLEDAFLEVQRVGHWKSLEGSASAQDRLATVKREITAAEESVSVVTKKIAELEDQLRKQDTGKGFTLRQLLAKKRKNCCRSGKGRDVVKEMTRRMSEELKVEVTIDQRERLSSIINLARNGQHTKATFWREGLRRQQKLLMKSCTWPMRPRSASVA